MQPPPPRQRASGTLPEAFAFAEKLEDEERLLDAMVAAMARGSLPDGTWERLHVAAQRDDRLSELAFAFESVSQGKRLKLLPPAAGAEFLYQAARYFADVFGDEPGALAFLERALVLMPGHAGAFGRIESLLAKSGPSRKLADVYAAAAASRPRAEQSPLLKRAATLLLDAGGADDKVIELLQQVLRLEAGDEDARSNLEALYVKANRLRDVVRLNEQALAADPPPETWVRRKLLLRIVELYDGRLHEPERAMPHVEQLLAIEPSSDEARRVAQKLLVIKGLAGRAAAAMAQASESFGTPQEVARYLTIELESTRGPKRASLLARLGRLKTERLGDDKGAFDAFEQALGIDPSDDEARARYVALAAKHARWADAARSLARVLATVKDPLVRAKASAQLGEMLVRGGDGRRAKGTLAGVLGMPESPPETTLAAARLLREVYEGEGDVRSLCEVLEPIATLEPDPDERRRANERLAEVAVELKDTARAIAAYERLLATSARARALAALAPLYEASGDPEKHARLLEEQAKDDRDDARARATMMRAAEVRATVTKDAAAAVAACRAIVERFGAARDVLALLVPLLEAQRQWPELATALAEDASLLDGTAYAAAMSRLGLLRLQRLKDVTGAIEAFNEALAFDPHDKTARATMEKLASQGEHRLAAARILEPLYRREGASGPLLRILELRGGAAEAIDERLEALAEAVDLAASSGAGEATRAAELAGRGLAEAVAGERPLSEWLERLDRVAGPGTDPKRRAALLGHAIGEREVTNEELASLTKRAAEAHAAAGDALGAIALYRRALAFEPSATELLARIDELLRDQGNPKERVALYRAALGRADRERRKELLHRIGIIERHDLADPDAAIGTYRAALEDDPDDADAFAALGELYAQAGRWEELSAQLEARLARVEGDAARATRARLAEVAAEHGDETRARAQFASLIDDEAISLEQLGALERVATRLGDPSLMRGVLLRRAGMTQDPREQIGCYERAGELDSSARGDLEAAAHVWKTAGALAEATGDDETARRLYGRARKVAPEDDEVTARLVTLSERAELWSDLPRLYAALGAHSTDEGRRVELWLKTAQVLAEKLGDVEGAARAAGRAFEAAPDRADVLSAFERLSVDAGALDAFEHGLDEALTRLEGSRTLGESGPERERESDARARLLLTRARVLAADPRRVDDAARAYRVILSDVRIDRARQADALADLEGLIQHGGDSPARRADRRWLLEWRADHAPEEERVARLLEWAHKEETAFGDPVHALALHRRVLAIDPESDEACASVARLALATGDTEEALGALASRRDRAEGPARIAVELEIAQVLLARTTRWRDALAALRAVLTEAPSEPTARALAAQLLAHRATRADAVAMLEQACDASDDVEARTQILARLLDAPADADEAQARRRWFERLCDLQRDQRELDAAMATAIRAARDMPETRPLWDRAEELARALARPNDVAALYEEVLARPLGRELALAIGERAVQFYEEWFEDSARVVRVLERVLELDPTADWAFDRLKLLLDSAERWDDLFALYDRALDSAVGKKRVALLEDAAQTAKDFADRPDRAIHYLEQLLDARPRDAKLAAALERLYERQGRHRELVSLLAARLPSLKPGEARRTRGRIAALWLDELGDAAGALDAIEPLLQTSEAANGSAADEWLLVERILAAAPVVPDVRKSAVPPPSDGSRPERERASRRPRRSEAPAKSSVRQRAAGWLHRHYEQTGREAELARVMLVELEAVKAPGERVKHHLRIAELCEHLGDAASALEQVGSAVVLDPEDEARRAKLADLADKTGKLPRLADLLASAAEACERSALRVALTMQAASVRADRVGDAAGAIGLLSSILAASGVADGDALAAARKLEALLEAAGRDEERLDVLERIASLDGDAAARREARGRAANLAARLGHNDRAVALWELRVLEDERDGEALDGLVDLLEREGKSEALVRALDLRARAAPSDERRRADRVRVATLLGEALARPGDATAAWRAIERDFGEADDAALALAGLLRQTKAWTELAELLARAAGRTADGAMRAELVRQLGDLQIEELGAAGLAVGTYADSLAADPSNPGARDGLLRLVREGTHAAAAVDVLLRVLRASDDWRKVLDLTSHRLALASADADKLAVLLDAAEIAEKRAGDAALAFESMRSALPLAPADEHVRSEAERLAEAAGAWASLADAYQRTIEAAASHGPSLVAALRAKRGTVLEMRLDDTRGALDEYLRVVGVGGDDATRCAAVRVAGKLEEWDAAARVVVDWFVSAGVAGGGLEAAAASPALLDVYEKAAEVSGAWGAAARALTERSTAGDLRGPAGRDVHARIAGWHRDRRGDPEAAEAALERALAFDEANAELLAALAHLQRRRRGRPLVETLQRLSRATAGDLGLLREAAEVALEAVGDRALAPSVLDELLALVRARLLRGSDEEPLTIAGGAGIAADAEWAIESLARLHDEAGDSQAMLEVFAAGSALPLDAATRREMRRRAARVALDRLSDHERGISLYLALLDEDPRDEEAIARLSETYAALGRTQELLDLRERQIATAGDAARIGLRLEAARLMVELGQGSRAVEALRANLRHDPGHPPTVEALASVLDAEVRTGELRDLLKEQARLAEEAGDAARGAELWARAAAIAEERLRDSATAEQCHARVVALVPRATSFDALARLATTRGDPAAAAQWLERLLVVTAPEASEPIELRLAEALLAAGDTTRAAERLERAVAASPSAERLRERLVGIYREGGRWAPLAQLVAEWAGHAADKPTRMARLLESARLYSERCSEPERAIPLLEQASDLAPDDPRVRLALADVLASAGRFEDARTILQAMIDAFGGRRPKERAPVHYQIARLELAMGNRARALVELDTATRVDPQNPEILRTLAELARDDDQLDRAEKSYRALLAVLRRRAEAGDSLSVARCEVLLELSAIASRQGQANRAREILESALETAQRSDFEQERLEQVLRARGDFETLVRVLEAKLARLGSASARTSNGAEASDAHEGRSISLLPLGGPESAAAARVLAEMADVLAQRLGRPDEALPVRLRAVATDPRSAAAHDAALANARAMGALDRYVDGTSALVDRALEAGDVQLACGLLVRLGAVAERDVGEVRRAAAFYERAVDLGLRTADVLRALDHLYERLGDADKQGRVLAMRVEVEAADGGPRAASDAVYRLAALRLTTRATLDDGIEMMRTALDLEPALDRAEQALRKAVDLDPTHRRAIDLYEQVARHPGHERALFHALELRSRLPNAHVETVREAVEVAVRIGEPGLAQGLLERFLEGENTVSQNTANLAWATGALASLHEVAGDLRRAVDLKKGAAALADPEVARRLLFEVARLAADRLGDLALAAETYETLRQVDPADREVWEPLLVVYRRLGDARKLADLLGAVVDFVEDVRERARLRLERVRTMSQALALADDEAAALLREIVDDDPTQIDAALMLAALLDRTGAHEELAALLARQIEAAKDRGDAPSIASLALRLGGLLEPNDPIEARNVYYTGLDWEPQSRELLGALSGLLERGDGDAGERADLLERRLALETGDAAEALALSLAQARADQGDAAAAERALAIGFRAHPTSVVLRERLEPAFRERGAWAQLAELCIVDAEARREPVERVARLREAAAIRRSELHDARGAAEALRKAREAAPADTALLRDLVDMLVEAGNWAEAAAELGTAIESLGDARERAGLLALRARIRSQSGQERGALEDMEAAFAIDPARYAGALAEQLTRSRAAATNAGDTAAVRALRLREAQVLPHKGDVDGARAILVELNKTDAKDRAPLRALVALEAGLERWDAASAALRRLMGLEEGAAAVETALALADACERAGRPGDARGALERARVALPHDRAVRERLERVYEHTGAWHELADLALDDARLSGDVAERFSLLLRAGTLRLERAGDPAAALGALEEARALRPADPDCAGLLADAYLLAGRGEDALALLEQLLAPQKGKRTKELAPIYWRLARVARYLGDAPLEIRSLVHALECDAQNGQVTAEVALRAMELGELELANRALRSVTLLRAPGAMSKALAYQYLGEIARKQGDAKRALVLLKRAVTEDPSLEGARALIAAIERG
jgi:tetratricopeptide (TPR) repeat protein